MAKLLTANARSRQPSSHVAATQKALHRRGRPVPNFRGDPAPGSPPARYRPFNARVMLRLSIATVAVVAGGCWLGGCAGPPPPKAAQVCGPAPPVSAQLAYGAGLMHQWMRCVDRAYDENLQREMQEDAAWGAVSDIGASMQAAGRQMTSSPGDYTPHTQPLNAPQPNPAPPDMGYVTSTARPPPIDPRTENGAATLCAAGVICP
jgi:hypothetical protein